jgi:hypothetical protein
MPADDSRSRVNTSEKERILLHVYSLGDDSLSKNLIATWLNELNNQCPDEFLLKARLLPSDEVSLAPWEGVPFIIAGRSDDVEKYFNELEPAEFRMFDDCAYFWVLTDRDQIKGLSGLRSAIDRVSVVSWKSQYFNTILTRLKQLARYPDLAGLSVDTHEVRTEIDRIASTDQGAWSPVLILGGPGAGKEVVAGALWTRYKQWRLEQVKQRPSKVLVFNTGTGSFAPVACGWFSQELLQDQLFGHLRGAFTGAQIEQLGLLESHQNGCILLDDFDAAPTVIYGALLRVMATSRGKAAEFSRLGDTSLRKTSAWLLFSTNANIDDKLNRGEIREDFVYRFEDRVIHLRGLAERPADIPSIAKRLWVDLWDGVEHPRNLTAAHIKFVMSHQIEWKGNVRQLRALLSLASSGTRRAAYQSLRSILEDILSRGDYAHWVRVILERRTAPLGARAQITTLPTGLTNAGMKTFNDICAALPRTRLGVADDIKLRLKRIVEEVAANKVINIPKARELNKAAWATVKKDLGYLSGSTNKGTLIECKGGKSVDYTAIQGMFS